MDKQIDLVDDIDEQKKFLILLLQDLDEAGFMVKIKSKSGNIY